MILAAEIRQEWRPLLEYSAHEVFRLMLGDELEAGGPARLMGIECTAMVGLAGTMRGVLSVRCPERAAALIASAMLNLPPEQSSHHAGDALAEVTNMIAGGFKNKIGGMADGCSLSVPTVVTGLGYTCHSLADTKPVELWFRFKKEPVQVILEIHS